jgi:hypothetical protein
MPCACKALYIGISPHQVQPYVSNILRLGLDKQQLGNEQLKWIGPRTPPRKRSKVFAGVTGKKRL